MKFFENITAQALKHNQLVCGDTCLCERLPGCTVMVMCDGIGSGVYANIAGITCASRIMQYAKDGFSLRHGCSMVAESMHRAREEDVPFSAFVAARVLSDGQFTVYTYEAPDPILIKNNVASVLKPHFSTAGYEVFGECAGTLELGDSLLIFSDGVSQAGLGCGYMFGIESKGVAEFVNRRLHAKTDIRQLPDEIVKMAYQVSGNKNEDDTTAALLQCRKANRLVVLTGPPTVKTKDKEVVENFIAALGDHVVCGSTTADIVARVLGRPVKMLQSACSDFCSPPEYEIDGIDMVTEGAVMLNQVYNIIDEPAEKYLEGTSVERLAAMMQNADVITFMLGNVINDAHQTLLFKQLGVRPRRKTVDLIAEKLMKMGKQVMIQTY